MNHSIQFELQNSEYIAKKLNPSDATILQHLYEQCTDGSLVVRGFGTVVAGFMGGDR
ncbi:MAG: hypothetical protein KME32_35935 [Mojavia pulchra JT2-VF2]|jgi:hypothetical protein|uniref:Uncharacterized protein n=1 Tax=Mojavia pulchra JT2-VF2 TaxID=287848 RepID=A0A951Q7N8_9NOST|nr:hypothetical protein [Mojavia pulchra JT2-VF2]